MANFTAAILTASDMVSKGERVDTSGDVLQEMIEDMGGEVVDRVAFPDDRAIIAEKLRQWADSGEIALVLTTGGTGLGPRDVTPEAALDVAERLVPGLAEAMRAQTLDKTTMAMVSRQVAATRGQCLIVTLPGSPRGVRECLEVIQPVLPHALEVLTQPRVDQHPQGS